MSLIFYRVPVRVVEWTVTHEGQLLPVDPTADLLHMLSAARALAARNRERIRNTRVLIARIRFRMGQRTRWPRGAWSVQ